MFAESRHHPRLEPAAAHGADQALHLPGLAVPHLEGDRHRVAPGVLVQFPFYAGIFGLISKTEIQHTLLGVELKVGNKRLSCPDLSTARYLQVFARLGCAEIAVPYDITKISHRADELESAWQRTLLLFEEAAGDKTPQAKGKLRAGLIKEIRHEIDEIGAGALMPEFRQSTKQRNN